MYGIWMGIPSTAALLSNTTQQRMSDYNTMDASDNTFLHFSSSLLIRYINNFDGS